MTKFVVTNSGYSDDIKRYASIIEEKIGIKIHRDSDENYYYVIKQLSTILKIVDVLDGAGIETGIIINRSYNNGEYVMEIYDDWRE